MQQFVSGEELARTIINYCRRSQETRFLSHQWTAEPVPTIINYCRDQETRFLKETGFLSHQWTAEPVPTSYQLLQRSRNPVSQRNRVSQPGIEN
ncbi:hypothetical protein SPLC1_S411780 [Arthrospira platensis C1]|nr:hypothetical protein SPLC1_S411780 [Arthrospira platensis C1]